MKLDVILIINHHHHHWKKACEQEEEEKIVVWRLHVNLYLVDSSCSSIICSHGSKCLIDENGLPRCYCPDDCNEYVHRISSEGPICGTDNQTYATICQLNKRACQIQQTLSIAHVGECGMLMILENKRKRSWSNRNLSSFKLFNM
jgi:hypothetical protein